MYAWRRVAVLVLVGSAVGLLSGAQCMVIPPMTGGDPAEFTNANLVRGGTLYDKYWTVTGGTAPTTDHPLWASRPDTTSNTRTGADTWRCKECHGWDYKGVSGAYGSGSHKTGIAGIFGTTKSAQEVFDLIKNSSTQTTNGHGYGTGGLSDADIWDLAKFVKEGQIDTSAIINTSKMYTGSATTGQTLYTGGIGTNLACSVCHGADGKTILFDGTDTLGALANDNPWELQHKIRYGHPGSQMPASISGGGSTQNVSDVGAYCQTLPQS